MKTKAHPFSAVEGLSLDAPQRKQFEAMNKLYRAYHYLFFPNKVQPAAVETKRILIGAIEDIRQSAVSQL